MYQTQPTEAGCDISIYLTSENIILRSYSDDHVDDDLVDDDQDSVNMINSEEESFQQEIMQETSEEYVSDDILDYDDLERQSQLYRYAKQDCESTNLISQAAKTNSITLAFYDKVQTMNKYRQLHFQWKHHIVANINHFTHLTILTGVIVRRFYVRGNDAAVKKLSNEYDIFRKSGFYSCGMIEDLILTYIMRDNKVLENQLYMYRTTAHDFNTRGSAQTIARTVAHTKFIERINSIGNALNSSKGHLTPKYTILEVMLMVYAQWYHFDNDMINNDINIDSYNPSGPMMKLHCSQEIFTMQREQQQEGFYFLEDDKHILLLSETMGVAIALKSKKPQDGFLSDLCQCVANI